MPYSTGVKRFSKAYKARLARARRTQILARMRALAPARNRRPFRSGPKVRYASYKRRY